MIKTYDLAEITDIINEATRETIAEDEACEHEGAIYNMKANLFKGLAEAESEAHVTWEDTHDCN